MARTPLITAEQVAAAANGLLAKGAQPTARAVRDVLGAGSMATVLKHFQAWQGTQVRPTQDITGIPRDLERVLLEFIGREVAAAKGAVESDLATAQQANADLIVESERQAVLIGELNASLQAAASESSSTMGRLKQVENDLELARSEVQAEREAAEHARTELAKSLLRLESMPRLEADLDQTRQAALTEAAGRAQSEQRAAVSEAKFQAEVDARKKAEAALQVSAEQLKEAMALLNAERLEGRTHSTELRDMERELLTLRAGLEQARQEAKLANEEAAVLRGRLQQKNREKPGDSSNQPD